MSNQKITDAAGTDPKVPPQEESSGLDGVKILVIAIGALVAVVVIGFIVAVVLALSNPGAAAGVEIIRDFFIIVMALEGILVGAALVVLVLQIARLTNLLQNEIKPIIEQTSDTVKTVKGTASFVSRNVADPVIKVSGGTVWLLTVAKELFGIRRAVKRKASNGAARRGDSDVI